MHTVNAINKPLRLVMAVLACGGIALGAATPANADPNLFGDLSCSCHQPIPGQHHADPQQILQGIEQGLSAPRTQHAYTERWGAGSSTTDFAHT